MQAVIFWSIWQQIKVKMSRSVSSSVFCMRHLAKLLQVVKYGCVNGKFANINGTIDKSGDNCNKITANPSYLQSELVVSFDVRSSCLAAPGDHAFGIFSDQTTFLLVVILVPIVGMLILIGIIVLAIPSTRKRLFPFRDR